MIIIILGGLVLIVALTVSPLLRIIAAGILIILLTSMMGLFIFHFLGAVQTLR